MEVRHLQAFVAVAEELHFGRAAARLQLSPSPVSRSVAELERELGTPLFVRSYHQVELTAAGSELLSKARKLLDGWMGFTALGRELARRSGPARVRVGAPVLVPQEVLTGTVTAVEKLSEGLPVDVEFGTSVELFENLRRRELDLAMTYLPAEGPDLEALSLMRLPHGIVMPSRHELASREELASVDLAGYRVFMISASVHPTAMGRVNGWLADGGAIVEQVPDADMVRIAQLIHQGLGLTLVPTTPPFVQLFDQAGLVLVPLEASYANPELGLVWRPDALPVPSPAEIRDFLTSQLRIDLIGV